MSLDESPNEDAEDDVSTDLLFGRTFDPVALVYEGVRVQPASTSGKALTLLANAVFNSAFVFCEWVDRALLDFTDKASVLELGAGTGLPTLRLVNRADISLARAVITDYPADEIMKPLTANVLANPAHNGINAYVEGLDWYSNEDIDRIIAINGGMQYDVILAADLLWYVDAHEALLDCISKILRRPSEKNVSQDVPRAILASGTYAKREDVRKFLQLAVKAGFKFREMNLDNPFDGNRWGTELTTRAPYQWHGSLNVEWEGDDGSKKAVTRDNLAARKNTVYAFELQWA